jgi:DNA-binding CsgD family transcriptional regulator
MANTPKKTGEPGTSARNIPDSQQRRRHNSSDTTTMLRRYEDNIYQLWDELSDFGSHGTHDALLHCMQSICAWIGAQNAYWMGAINMMGSTEGTGDCLGGWRIGRMEVLNPECTSPKRMKTGSEVLHTNDPGDTTIAVVSGAGRFRVHSLGTGIVELKSFKKTDHYDFFYRQMGITDRIWVAFPINVDAESFFVFDTFDEGRQFNTHELYQAAEILRGIKWFHRQLLLSHGLSVSSAPLTPAERRIVPELLSGAAEKTIAERLKLTKATVHQYATGVYRKFGVRGRAEFMAVWLRGCL